MTIKRVTTYSIVIIVLLVVVFSPLSATVASAQDVGDILLRGVY